MNGKDEHGHLSLTFRLGETVYIGDDVTVTYSAYRGNQIVMTFAAPRGIAIDRQSVRMRKNAGPKK